MTTTELYPDGALIDVPSPALYITGFSGTRTGVTNQQKEACLLYLLDASEFHHGDCVGADEEIQQLALRMGIPCIAHPGLMERWQARTEGNLLVHIPKPELQRDRDIARECERLVATPATYTEELRSGTWATCRYAHHMRKPVIVIYPDGSVDKDWKPDKINPAT